MKSQIESGMPPAATRLEIVVHTMPSSMSPPKSSSIRLDPFPPGAQQHSITPIAAKFSTSSATHSPYAVAGRARNCAATQMTGAAGRLAARM
jgi:hypothetical protein